MRKKKPVFSECRALLDLGILLALMFQENYCTEQHHCGENYYGDNLCLAVE